MISFSTSSILALPRHLRQSRRFSDAASGSAAEASQIEWSGLFDERVKAIIEECQALEDEMCKSVTTPDRQAHIGKLLKSNMRIRQHGSELMSCYSDRNELVSILSTQSEDEETKLEFKNELMTVEERIKDLRRMLTPLLIPRDPDDDCDVILEARLACWVRAAAGGSEASLFASEMFQMYQLFSVRKGWNFEVLDKSESEVGGLKEATASITGGEEIYGLLKFESGVHRVQRVPETETMGRVHTSTISVAIMVDSETPEFALNPSELKIELMRASGAGGQSVNTTDSAVRITHLPTGVSVHCRDERSQHRNKAKGLKILQARLYDIHKAKIQNEESILRKSLIGSGDRSERIRTYNYAQDRITDHRANVSVHGVEEFLQGGEAVERVIDALRGREIADRIQAYKLKN
ncbi:hypothetical protein GUITHDRAFT_136406 [Guillardia theta CCMP2712]|uniref:Prokaryotic-type class I peptide chain release factors domain-containing protein n=1 Tax=Guillardia theta (strain CCMP2712) TaxID=905079 RepID=L1JJK9_GUITC|nr:hypothetical protein GUITHDRAFT_136406 [Guillardia theta CCMP2712]EKX48718.1 hypothetical protein GUITHDRAFT_136406 [Guillardia theta CCMP2712]|eukprot:XP_005835698.1 hypothetical protein GUITHDRAFT_136406 [Guillardia theta CCMP2712]